MSGAVLVGLVEEGGIIGACPSKLLSILRSCIDRYEVMKADLLESGWNFLCTQHILQEHELTR